MKRIFVSPKKFLVIFLITIAFIGIGMSGFFYLQYRKAQNTLNSPIFAGQLEAQDLVKKISRFMLLPENEIPTIATVSDFNKLKDQQFFRNSHNGDKLLIFTKAKIAILYNPQSDKIINVGPLNIGQGQEQVGVNKSPPPLRVALYNGTKVTGLTNTIEQQLKSKIGNVTISIKENAKNIYKKTLVVDLTGNQQKITSDLVQILDGEVGSLPKGESSPANTDVLVILGK